MKKFLIMLVVVAMATFLFVGCFGTTPPIEPDEPDDPILPTTVAPIITEISGVNFPTTTAQFFNKILVSGIAPTNSVIRIYVNGVNTGIGYVGTDGKFTVVSGTSIVTVLDGAKTLYATATEVGLAESVPSASYEFTYDTTPPKIVKAVADTAEETIIVTFDEGVKATLEHTAAAYAAATDAGKLAMDAAWGMSALNTNNWTITLGTGGTLGTPSYVATSSTVIRITLSNVGDVGTVFRLICTGIGDSLGNTIKTTAPSTYVGVVTN